MYTRLLLAAIIVRLTEDHCIVSLPTYKVREPAITSTVLTHQAAYNNHLGGSQSHRRHYCGKRGNMSAEEDHIHVIHSFPRAIAVRRVAVMKSDAAADMAHSLSLGWDGMGCKNQPAEDRLQNHRGVQWCEANRDVEMRILIEKTIREKNIAGHTIFVGTFWQTVWFSKWNESTQVPISPQPPSIEWSMRSEDQ